MEEGPDRSVFWAKPLTSGSLYFILASGQNARLERAVKSFDWTNLKLTFSRHAYRRTHERGIGYELVEFVVENAEVRYPGALCHKHRRVVHVLSDIVVVTNEPGDDRVVEVISVMWRNREGATAA